MRLPRFFGKKRGHRRTGSQAWGSFGDGAFHGALLLAGLVFGGLLVSGVAVPEWRINHDFVATPCTIVGKGLARTAVQDRSGSTAATWQPRLRVRYEADGLSHEAWSRPPSATAATDRDLALGRLATWQLGETLPGWYDPSNPAVVVLERGYNWWMWLLALLLPGALVAFGGSGLLRAVRRWGRSEESQAAAAGLNDMLDPLSRVPRHAPDHPAVPACEDMVNSPGTILRYRLPIESPESWTLLGFGLFALLWNAVLAVLAVGAGLDLMGGRRDWLLLALLIPFAVVGIAGIGLFIRGLVLATASGTTQLEISDHPLRPGERYDVLLAQGGAGTLRNLEMTLEVEEQATFRQGTDTRSEKVVVARQPVHSWRGVQLVPGTRFEAHATITIPPDAMHSFASEHNSIRWMIVVRGRPARWPAFTRVFPLIVFPAPATGARAGGEAGS